MKGKNTRCGDKLVKDGCQLVDKGTEVVRLQSGHRGLPGRFPSTKVGQQKVKVGMIRKG